MDRLSNRSGVGSDDITDETTSLADLRWSSDEDSSDPQEQCLAVPQAPLQTYKQKLVEFRKLFKELPDSEILIVDYPCALQRDILLQGRLYLSENWICFHSNVFRGTKIMLTLDNITTMTREKTARLIPNAIQICTSTDKFFFASFSAREKSYQVVFRMWQNTLLDKSLTSLELWQMVKQHYGNDLGLNHEEMENLQVVMESSTQTSFQQRLGGDESLGRLERPNSLRLPVLEHGPVESSTPQGEELPSPIGSQSTTNTDESRNTPSQQRGPLFSPDSNSPEVSKRSTHSLDLNANENEASEQSGSEDIEESHLEGHMDPTQMPGRLYINKVFHISADKMFELLFTDSEFTRRFMNIRKITNISSTPWQKDVSGSLVRTLNYTITISNPLIGKFSTATETQTLYKSRKEGQYYLVDSVVHTHDVPYHDYFYTQNRYYIVSNSKRKCRLRVYSDVKYRKQPWGLVKTFITKNSWSGIEENFRHLEAELQEEEPEINQAGGESGKMGGLRRRRRTYSRSHLEHIKPNKQYGMDPDQNGENSSSSSDATSPQRWKITTIVAGMSLILLILTFMNLALFFKLWAMEDVAHRIFLSTKQRLREKSDASLIADFGPKLGSVYQNREDAELLKTVLQDSINLLEQLRSSLVALQQSLASTNQTAAPQ